MLQLSMFTDHCYLSLYCQRSKLSDASANSETLSDASAISETLSDASANSGTLSDASANLFFVIPFYLQSVPVHSANCVNIYAVACTRVHSSAVL
jgi:hypothetical protein